MAHTKHILIADFGNQKAGDSVIVGDNQIDYFVENGWIEVKSKSKKKKAKAKIEVVKEEVKNEN